MRIATFNLENLDLRSGEEEVFDRRAAILRPLLERAAADVLCLQEINAQKTHHHDPRALTVLDRLVSGSRYEGYYRAQTVRPKGTGPMDVHNLVVLSRRPIIESRQVHHDLVAPWTWTPPSARTSPAPPIAVSWDRPALHVRIDLDGGLPLHIVNLHLRASRAVPIFDRTGTVRGQSTSAWAEGFFLAAQKQIGQALEVRLLVDGLFDADPSASILVCGDMNADEHEMPIRLLCAASDDAGGAHPDERALVPLEDRLPLALRYSVRHAGRPVMLDHLLASQSMARRCIGVEVFNEGLADEAYVTGAVPGSLHAALVADFSEESPPQAALDSTADAASRERNRS
jgi:endonuclease/exonuclease/phosphatase family metal-dependent hydrolase